MLLLTYSQLKYFEDDVRDLSISLSGLGGEGEADPVSGSVARRTSHPALGEDASVGAIYGAGEEGQGGQEWPRRKGTSDVTSEDDEAHSSVPEDNDEEEEENNPPPEKKKKKRAAPAHLEAETPKKGKGVPAVTTAWDVDSSPERRPRSKPRAAS